jgi:kinase-associated protein B
MYLVGDHVIASYKTGDYIGEVVDISGMKAAVKVLAVLKHPTQGDLHHPNQTNVGFFHQRRALAYQEIALMPFDTIIGYHQAVLEYKESLRRALEQEKQELHNGILFAQKCLDELEKLEKDYFPE